MLPSFIHLVVLESLHLYDARIGVKTRRPLSQINLVLPKSIRSIRFGLRTYPSVDGESIHHWEEIDDALSDHSLLNLSLVGVYIWNVPLNYQRYFRESMPKCSQRGILQFEDRLR